ncbi:MAG TPA: class I SAM-dependent methyltransferase [Bryobacteraceae bacterium]|nr:class I SAM-dependent methyltransferase [Bryobacteraceae bacterium]
MLGRIIHVCSALPPLRKVFYKQFYEYVTRNYKFEDWTCMNLGYAPLDGDLRLDLQAAEEPNRYGFQLYHHVASAVDLSGLDVLEVGCGRGGGTYYVMRQFKPASLIGLDFSSECVTLATNRYKHPGLSFAKGDAENLPYKDGTMDAVINIESTHCYGNVERFLSEVYRVLRPGGYFLFADFRDLEQAKTLHHQLRHCGLTVLKNTDITANVVRALDLDSDRKREFFARNGPAVKRLEPLAGIKGSRVFEAFSTGKMVHQRAVLQKPAPAHLTSEMQV